MQEPGSDLVLIARAVRTHGLKGEVVAELLTDFPERFEDLEQVTSAWHWTLETDDYLALCATHSNKAALEPRTREALLDGLRELIDGEFDGAVTEHYVAVAGLGRRA